MFNLGAPEMIFILILALLIFGPKRLPQLGRTMGKAIGEFRRATTELQRSINLDVEEADRAERERRRLTEKQSTGAEAPQGASPDGGEEAPEPSAAAFRRPGPSPPGSVARSEVTETDPPAAATEEPETEVEPGASESDSGHPASPSSAS